MEKRFWNLYGESSKSVNDVQSADLYGESSMSVNVVQSDVSHELVGLSELESLGHSTLVSRLNTKLTLLNQKMSILVDNAEDLNLKQSKVRALTREVLLQEKLN